jgi:hypothetical protein
MAFHFSSIEQVTIMRKKLEGRVSEATLNAVKEKELAEVKHQASRAAEDIQFFLDCNAEGRVNLDYSRDSLIPLEAAFRRLSMRKDKLPNEFPFDMFARLAGLYLGEVIVRQTGGAWEVYIGQNYTLNRIVVRIGDKYCDPLRFGTVLDEAKAAHGASAGKALHYFATKLDSAFP